MSIWSDQTGFDLFGADQPGDSSDEFDGTDFGLEIPQQGDSGWTPGDGYPDSTGSVRIWVDDDLRLTKVVVSNRWRERRRGTSLSSMFDEAFLLAHARLGVASDPVIPREGKTPTLSAEALSEFQEQSFEAAEEAARLDALPADEVRPSRWQGTPVEGVSNNRMVTARLNLFGHTEQTLFDEEWLAQSRVSQLCEAVMEAHQDAYSRFQPPVFEPGERELLAQRFDRLSSDLLAMIKQGW